MCAVLEVLQMVYESGCVEGVKAPSYSYLGCKWKPCRRLSVELLPGAFPGNVSLPGANTP